MFTVKCFQCPCCVDLPFQDFATQQAEQHAQAYGHNVGVYATESLREGQKRECVAVILKYRQKAA